MQISHPEHYSHTPDGQTSLQTCTHLTFSFGLLWPVPIFLNLHTAVQYSYFSPSCVICSFDQRPSLAQPLTGHC